MCNFLAARSDIESWILIAFGESLFGESKRGFQFTFEWILAFLFHKSDIAALQAADPLSVA